MASKKQNKKKWNLIQRKLNDASLKKWTGNDTEIWSDEKPLALSIILQYKTIFLILNGRFNRQNEGCMIKKSDGKNWPTNSNYESDKKPPERIKKVRNYLGLVTLIFSPAFANSFFYHSSLRNHRVFKDNNRKKKNRTRLIRGCARKKIWGALNYHIW